MNKVIIRGNMVADPFVKTVAIGEKQTSVVNFTVAVSRFFQNSSGKKDKDTVFLPCEAWDTGAETIGKIFQRGDPILLEGSLKAENYETKEGKKISKIKIRVSNFEKLVRFHKVNDIDNEPAEI